MPVVAVVTSIPLAVTTCCEARRVSGQAAFDRFDPASENTFIFTANPDEPLCVDRYAAP
jgi:hypothetical protein